jgi:allophanate hydrolase subunit 2
MIEVIKSGLETSVQDYPGRIGYWPYAAQTCSRSSMGSLCGCGKVSR